MTDTPKTKTIEIRCADLTAKQAADLTWNITAALVDHGLDLDLFIGVQGGKIDAADSVQSAPAAVSQDADDSSDFSTGDADLDCLLEATAHLCKGPEHNNMDDGIYWDRCREKVVARLRQVPPELTSRAASLESLRELALQSDASENGPEQLVFSNAELLDFANKLTGYSASQSGHVLTTESLRKWATGSGAIENGPGHLVFGNEQLLSFGRALVFALRPFQERVQPWMMTCFGPEISADKKERNHRFLEEAIELVQSTGCTRSEAHQLVDYVYNRPVGETPQEVGGVMVTLAALCLAHPGLDMHECGEVELARIWTKVEKIRAKQAAKPAHSPLPEHTESTSAVKFPLDGLHRFWHHKSNPFDLYTLVAKAKLQTGQPANDMAEVLVYAGPTGVWVRPTEEFMDGRFHEANRANHSDQTDEGSALVLVADEQAKVAELVKRIHQVIKRGADTKDHGLVGNLRCILDHLIPDPPNFMDTSGAPPAVTARQNSEFWYDQLFYDKLNNTGSGQTCGVAASDCSSSPSDKKEST